MPPLHPGQGLEFLLNKGAMTTASLMETPSTSPLNPEHQSGRQPDFSYDENYDEPDFTPPKHRVEHLGLHTGQVRIQLIGSTIMERAGMQIAIVGSQKIQQSGQPDAESDGWYDISEATEERTAAMTFNVNHQTFAARYRAGYSYFLERSYAAIRPAKESGKWQIDESINAYHERVMRSAIESLPRDLYQRRGFGQDGYLYDSAGRMHATDGRSRPHVDDLVDELTAQGIDHVVMKQPLSGSFVLINSGVELASVREVDAMILQFPERLNLEEINTTYRAIAGA